MRTQRHVVHPTGPAPHHRRYGLSRDDEDPIVAVARDEALQIVHTAIFVAGRQLIARAQQSQTLALRSEQRLHHQSMTACGFAHERRTRLRGLFRDPGRRGVDPGFAQEHRSHRFVHSALDRARGVVHRHAVLAQRMQQTQAQRDLLERALGNLAHEHRVGQPRVETGNHDTPAVRLQIHATIRQRCERARDAELRKRSRQPAAVPAGGVGEDGYGCGHLC